MASDDSEPAAGGRTPDRLTLSFACAQCGGPLEAGPDDLVVDCPWCGSWSRLLRARVADACAVECPDLTESDLAAAWIEREVATFRATRMASAPREDDLLARAIAEQEAAAAARRERDRLRREVRVGRRRLIRVPYLHEHADGLQVVLGRDEDGMKRTAVVGFTAEETEPAYDTRRHDFRDRGLRLHRGRLRLLSAEDVREGFEGLPVADPRGVATYRVNAQRAKPRQDRLSELVRIGELFGRRREIVYKPYWVAELHDGARTEWLLVDGQTGLAAGNVGGADELGRLLEPPGESPFLPDWEAKAVLVPHRCPECGQDLEPDRRAWFLPCAHCHVGLVRGDDGLERRSYSHVPVGAQRADWLPAWRFRFTSPTGLTGLRALRAALGARDADEEPEQTHVWVPALRLLGSLPGDRAFARFADEAHHAEWEVVDEPLSPVTQGRVLGATLSAEQAEPLARAAVAASLRVRELVRVNAALFREHVLAHGWRFEEPRLVLLPGRLEGGDRFRLHGARWHLPGRPKLT
jgi:DNA-directed RNA polymerase subunit RPC12/RpoP